MIRHLLPIYLCIVLSNGRATAADPEKPAADDLQPLIFFGEARPVLIHMHVRVNGQPLPVTWDQMTRTIFDSLDADKDGSLSPAELEKLPPPQVLFGGNFNLSQVQPPMMGPDSKVTLDQFRSYFRRNGGAAFQVNAAPAGTRRFGPSADVLNHALYNLLDADKDGKLSHDELARVPALLMQKDVDDDEIIDPVELLGPMDPQFDGVAQLRESNKNRIIVPTFRTLNPGDAPSELVRQLIARYGPGGQSEVRKLTARQIGLDEATFKLLDVDENGELDNEELMRFAKRPPDIELIVRLRNVEHGKPPLDVISTKELPLIAKLRPAMPGTLILELGTTRVEIQTRSGNIQGAPKFVEEQRKAQFRKADADNNGYIDMNEARRNGVLLSLFKLMDADGDGKLYEKEMLGYLDRLATLQTQATAAVVALRVSDEGRGLFDLIDSHRDGRLSLREMRSAVQLINALDRDQNGTISKPEIPRAYQVSLEPGSGRADPVTGVALSATTVENSRAPRWFQKMDLNHDGDISRREFLGTDQQFKDLDTDGDGDGLISAEEAIAFELRKSSTK